VVDPPESSGDFSVVFFRARPSLASGLLPEHLTRAANLSLQLGSVRIPPAATGFDPTVSPTSAGQRSASIRSLPGTHRGDSSAICLDSNTSTNDRRYPLRQKSRKVDSTDPSADSVERSRPVHMANQRKTRNLRSLRSRFVKIKKVAVITTRQRSEVDGLAVPFRCNNDGAQHQIERVRLVRTRDRTNLSLRWLISKFCQKNEAVWPLFNSRAWISRPLFAAPLSPRLIPRLVRTYWPHSNH
jgi:hypothetical protein